MTVVLADGAGAFRPSRGRSQGYEAHRECGGEVGTESRHVGAVDRQLR